MTQNAMLSLVPRLSIGLPVYNGESFLEETLDGMRRQTYGNFELIISDNASTDRTEQICRQYASEDRRIRYVRQDRNLGAVANFNHVFSLGNAPFFKWIAHDDAYDPRYLDTVMAIIETDPDVVLAHTAVRFIDETGKEFARDDARGGYAGPWDSAYRYPDSTTIGDSPSARDRFRQVLIGALWGTHMFGVIRRDALARTELLANFVSSDRAMLAELALMGRFRAAKERYFKKRFHADVSWALSQKELKTKLSTGDVAYSRRLRQLKAFLSAPWNKPVNLPTKIACTGLVLAHSLRTVREIMASKDAHNEAIAKEWHKPDRDAA
ncbi:MAG: glycosyltransferase family 2 protein [Hyphomicrobiaceae bacterium]